MSGVVEMLNRYFSPFVIVNRVEERIIAREDIEGTIFSKKEKDYSSFKDRSINQNLINRNLYFYILKNTRISVNLLRIFHEECRIEINSLLIIYSDKKLSTHFRCVDND